MFHLPTRNKTTWMHPRSKHWHLIDYAIVRRRDLHDVLVTKSMCGADCWTDHRLILCKVKFHIQPPRRPQGKKPAKRLNVQKLINEDVKQQVTKDLEENLSSLTFNTEDIEQDWALFKDTVHSMCNNILGPKTHCHQDWFDENNKDIDKLIDEKNRLLQVYLAHKSQANLDALHKSKHTVQIKLRQMKDKWMQEKTAEIQGFADTHNTKEFYKAVRTLYGPQPGGAAPLLSADGTKLISDKPGILDRWAEHFEHVLNRPSSVSNEAIDRLPQAETDPTLDNPPTYEKTVKAISLLSSGKAPGADAIPAEIFKVFGPTAIQKLTELFQSMWQKETIPQDLKDASIVHLYKGKGNIQACDNHRGISLLSIAGKVLARILLNRLLCHLENGLLPESQCGFRAGRGTVDMIFAAKQLQEKCQEQHTSLYTTFIDLTKAFDTVNRSGLWKIMAKFGCPPRFISMVRQFHDGMQAHVLEDGNQSAAFQVTNGVKQGCVLAPTLFSMMFTAMLADAYSDSDPGIDIKYRTDGIIFNLRRLQAKTKVHYIRLRDLLFADDCALNASTGSEMQESVDKFSDACDNFGLTISTKKTEVMFQPVPNTIYEEPEIYINSQRLNPVERFTYLGSTLSRVVHIDDEVNVRISKASAVFGRLSKNVWNQRGISTKTKLGVYRAVVLTSLLYACETWTVYQRHAKKLNHFHTICLRKILGIKWQDHIPDTEVLDRANMFSINTMLQQAQLRWAGHVRRMSDTRIPKQLLYGELRSGTRDRGGQKKRYKDTLKISAKQFQIDPDSWEELAEDRSRWRSSVKRGAKLCEDKRVLQAMKKRHLRKTRAESIVVPTGPVCPECGRTFHARIGLVSHLRTHNIHPRQHTSQR